MAPALHEGRANAWADSADTPALDTPPPLSPARAAVGHRQHEFRREVATAVGPRPLAVGNREPKSLVPRRHPRSKVSLYALTTCRGSRRRAGCVRRPACVPGRCRGELQLMKELGWQALAVTQAWDKIALFMFSPLVNLFRLRLSTYFSPGLRQPYAMSWNCTSQ